MKLDNIILGKRSYLSIELKKKIKNTNIFSLEKFPYGKIGNKKYNLIINSFYSSLDLKEIKSYEKFFKKSLYELSIFLDNFPTKKINKILYTSSSSIYNSVNDYDLEDSRNRIIYSTTKFAAENLIRNFSKKNNIKFCIARIFNIFGDNEKFSVISKILESYKTKKKLYLFNKGNSVRDFIHINDVVKIYKNIIQNSVPSKIDVGSGFGYKIDDIIKSLGYNNFNLKKIDGEESNFSIASVESNKLADKLRLEKFFIKKLKLKKKIKFEKIFSSKKNILYDYLEGSVIYGAGEAGKKLLKLYKQNNKEFVSFFVDDKKSLLKRKYIEGKKIYSFHELTQISKKRIINNIIIAIPSIKPEKLKQLIKKLTPLALNVSIVNTNLFGQNSFLSLSDATNTVLFDLLKRKPKFNINLLKSISNKTILITGAGGSIGTELVKQTLGSGAYIIALDHSELALYDLEKNLSRDFNKRKIKIILGSITDKELLNSIMKKYKIDIVFHAAAYKHVNILENNISLAIKNNILGTCNLLKIFNKRNLQIIIISTDKAARPKSILGATKRISEIISQNYNSSRKYLSKIKIVRFGNVFGSKGSAIELFLEQINKKDPITITDYRVKRYFMSIREACNLVIQTTKLKNENKIYILNMGTQILLKDIILKLAEIKKIDKKNLIIRKTGLKKGEKLFEELSISKKYFNTRVKDILSTEEPNYSEDKVENLLKILNKNLFKKNQSFLRKKIFTFLSKEK
tara:strand:- start:1874 stop:4102 length:2229 start_codon:yes stop_codon:yes gene_type:complete